MSVLKNPVVLSLLGSLLAVLVLYVNNKITKQKHKKTEYLKLFFLVFIIQFLTLQIFIFNVENESGLPIDSGNVNIEMRGGNPDF